MADKKVTSDYRIISFDNTTGTIVVAWDYNQQTHTINLYIEDGAYITGDHLDQYIRGFFPIQHYQRLEQIKSGISNESHIEDLVDTTYVPPVVENTNIALTQELADSIIANTTPITV